MPDEPDIDRKAPQPGATVAGRKRPGGTCFPERSLWAKSVIALFVCFLVAGLYGAVPFFSLPDLGQVLWTSGFAVSFANSNWSSLRAEHFGYPAGAPMVFGLPTGLVQSVLIKLFRLHPGDAYAATAILFLCSAVLGCISLARRLGASYLLAALFAMAYLTLPLVWWHSGYSSISYGFAFLPLYLLAAFRLVDPAGARAKLALNAAFFSWISLVAIFMDGYTGVMFFVASGIIWLCQFARRRRDQSGPTAFAGLWIALSAAVSYALYAFYVGTAGYERMSMDFFRGWGVDLVMLVVPSQGISWLGDVLGWSVQRSEAQFFGDASVWSTSFAMIVLIGVGLAYVSARRDWRALALLLISLGGLYFCLGPSLKINSTRPEGQSVNQQLNPLMPAEAALAPTGSAVLSKYLPGFKNMRGAYRWIGLLFAGGLALITLAAGSARYGRLQWLFPAILLLTIAFNLPNPEKRTPFFRGCYSRLHLLDTQLLSLLRRDLPKNSKVAFVPPGNDFIVHYLAAQLEIRSLNAGGDKNVALARRHWPATMLAFERRAWNRQAGPFRPGSCFIHNVRSILLAKDVDSVILPFFDSFAAAFWWPWDAKDAAARRSALEPSMKEVEKDERLMVEERPYYFLVRRRFEDGKRIVIKPTFDPPCGVFLDGWHGKEGNGRWSGAQAELAIPLPEECTNAGTCAIRLGFQPLVAEGKSSKVEFELEDGHSESRTLTTMDPVEVVLPIRSTHSAFLDGVARLSIRAPDADSPQNLGINEDFRVLGILLLRIQVLTETELSSIE